MMSSILKSANCFHSDNLDKLKPNTIASRKDIVVARDLPESSSNSTPELPVLNVFAHNERSANDLRGAINEGNSWYRPLSFSLPSIRRKYVNGPIYPNAKEKYIKANIHVSDSYDKDFSI